MSFAFLRTGQLWLAMGLHAGWDFFVAVFWGTPVSGLRLFHLLTISFRYPALSSVGIEIIEFTVITVLVYLYTARRKSEIVDW